MNPLGRSEAWTPWAGLKQEPPWAGLKQEPPRQVVSLNPPRQVLSLNPSGEVFKLEPPKQVLNLLYDSNMNPLIVTYHYNPYLFLKNSLYTAVYGIVIPPPLLNIIFTNLKLFSFQHIIYNKMIIPSIKITILKVLLPEVVYKK